jgi:hypothetical protein
MYNVVPKQGMTRLLLGACLLSLSLNTASSADLELAGGKATLQANGNITISLTIANTGQKAYRVFAKDRPISMDDVGNSWNSYATGEYISGVFACPDGDYCLHDPIYIKQVSQSATVIDPKSSANIVIQMFPAQQNSECGSTVSVGFTIMAQEITSGQLDSPQSFVKGWNSLNVGAPNIPLRCRTNF